MGYHVLYWTHSLHVIFYKTKVEACLFIERRIKNSLNVLEDFTMIRGTTLNLRRGVVADE